MEGEEIGLVLARAAAPPTSAPASKISVCIAAAVARPPPQRDTEAAVKRLGVGEEEVESLIGMNNALESLERQLASLQRWRPLLKEKERQELDVMLSRAEIWMKKAAPDQATSRV